ncbi:beta-fructofuranosidase [Gracilibacillus halotolerans]|uniref:Sucrose-6-phosphate hydrolase n=1 Tax=Gracilibacillus halotolerans TaxID=74386 RepID=A0A841RKJ8_9BACI|nr:sucrose-6-phosphate hydrolase [Gracilibacillus halotolerans]MBB6512143.1 beta-fructofuranosidase [Gracilibacillus halotolerans]
MNREHELLTAAIEKANENKSNIKKDPYYPLYHVASPVGLINDPNGWIQWKGTYHLFFQWNPFENSHGAKFWGHVTSTDLVHWKEESPALAPSESYEKDGCYSGSAIAIDDKLYLFYTGNVKNDDQRESYQCIAVSQDGHQFRKLGNVLDVPEGYTAHFRDPKVWKENDVYYMVMGAQTLEEKGCVLLFQSKNLHQWENLGVLADGFGYMWECPDFFSLQGKDVLLFSPQGMEPEGIHYQNTFQSGYFIGEWKEGTNRYTHNHFQEIDHGFDFYAPQTTEDEKGRRILIAWMGMADGFEHLHPTLDYNWIHQLTIPRELSIRDNKLIQQPVEELKQLRGNKLYDRTIKDRWNGEISRTVEWIFKPNDEQEFTLELYNGIQLVYNQREKTLSFYRERLDHKGHEVRTALVEGNVSEVRAYVDRSSIELFINDGELTFTSRIFPSIKNKEMQIHGDGHLTVWNLAKKVGE